MKLEKINETPVKCFRWLNVDAVTVEIPFSPTEQKKPMFSTVGSEKEVTLSPYKGVLGIDTTNTMAAKAAELTQITSNQGFTLEVPAGKFVEEPIEISFMANQENQSILDVSEIIVGENSSATVVLRYEQEDVVAARVGYLRVKSENNSKLKIIKMVNMSNSVETMLVEQDAYSETEVISADFGKENNVGNYHCKLMGDDSSNCLRTVYLGQGKDVLDFNFMTEQIGRHTKSEMDTRGILRGEAKKTLRSTLHFRKGSKQSRGSEGEYVMLVSDTILNNSIPLLLCDEDDVSGEHAAGIGRVDEDTMFYLTTRGFSPEQAKNILVKGYLTPVLDTIKQYPIHKAIEQEIESRMVEA